MAGFLDKNTRIIDMILTGRGRELQMLGKLKYVYWAVFDDEVDYNPPLYDETQVGPVAVLLSGSATPERFTETLNALIETTPVREATTGYQYGLNFSASDSTNVIRPMFTMAQGQDFLPRMTVNGDQTTGVDVAGLGVPVEYDIEVKQQQLQNLLIRRDTNGNVIEKLGPYPVGQQRFDSSEIRIEMSYTKDSFPTDHPDAGFLLRVYKSGSDGLTQVEEKQDLSNTPAYGADMNFDVRSKNGGR